VSIVDRGPLEPMIGDPDDHRPRSAWRLIVDPGDANGRVDGLAMIEEAIAPGDRIPLHTHDVDEVIAIVDGTGQAQLGATTREVGPGSVVFIPAGVSHATLNSGNAALLIHAVFPATEIDIRMLERNPAPGTISDAPRWLRYDLRTGEFEIIGKPKGPSG
jgi:quercetin dioxygenase-like cupin family protein